MNVKIENNSVNLCDSCEKDCETCDAYDKDYLPGDCDTNICCCSKYAPLMTRQQLNDGHDNNVGATDLISRRAALDGLEELPLDYGRYDSADVEYMLEQLPQKPITPCNYVEACNKATMGKITSAVAYFDALEELRKHGYVLVDMRKVTI